MRYKLPSNAYVDVYDHLFGGQLATLVAKTITARGARPTDALLALSDLLRGLADEVEALAAGQPCEEGDS